MAGGFCFAEERMTEKKTETVTRTDDQHGAGMHTRLSKFMKKDVHNADGKDIGDVKDVVLDGNANRVSYVVVSYGGVMGIGVKLFAIPWNAFEFRHDDGKDMTKEKDRDDYKLFLTLSDENLKNAPGFDDKKWPDMADKNFRDQVNTYWREHRTAKDDKGVDTRMTNMPDKSKGGVNDGDSNVLTDVKTGPSDSKGLMWVRRASKVIGTDVHNKANEDIGDIKDLVVDSHSGRISYAVLSYGGVMGLGDKLFAVPIDSFATKADDDKFVLDVNKDQLKNAQGFDEDHWPDFASAEFRKGVDSTYHRDGTDHKH
jgi:sporulation protein YlmC with PRC-barrel domain